MIQRCVTGLLIAGWLLVGAAGCSERTKPQVGAALGSATGDELSQARKLALAATKGSSAVDRELVALERVAVARPEQAEVWASLGQLWLRKARESGDAGYYLYADASAQVALKLAPTQRAAANLRALVLLEEHRFTQARDAAEQILAREPEDVTALGTVSDAELELGHTEQARDMARRMLSIKPNLPSYSRVSYLAWLEGDRAAALENIRLAIDAGGSRADREARAWCIVQAALLFWSSGDVPGAAAGFEQALQVIDGYPPALVGQGRVALARGEAGRAAELLKRAFAARPLVETGDLLAQALDAAGDHAGAQAALGSAEAEGRRGDARGLSLLYSTRDLNHAEALSLAERERLTRDDIFTEDALAWALYRAGRFAEARTASERALRHGTREPRLLYHQGAILLKSGDPARGRALIAAALALNAHFDVIGASEAQRLLGDDR
jgi:tetratricopeptide (TPR) repeat protein